MRSACFLILLMPVFATATSLNELFDEAAHHNPDIAASLSAWQGATQVSSQVSTLPDPLVTMQHVAVGSPRPFAGFTNNDFAYLGLGVSQDLPWPGKLRLKGESADRDAGVNRQKFEATKKAIFQQIAAAYFQLGYIRKMLDVLEHDQALLDQIEKI